MTEHAPRMTTHDSTSTRRFGACSLLGGAALVMALAVTARPAAQAAGAAAKPAKAAKAAKAVPAAVDAKAIYETKCQFCHMADGNSQIMPNMSFADGIWKHGSTLKAVQTTITNGAPGTAMAAFKGQLTPAEIAAMAKFVRKFDKKLK